MTSTLDVLVRPVAKASDIHKPPIIFLYALVDFLVVCMSREILLSYMLCYILVVCSHPSTMLPLKPLSLVDA